MSPNTDNKEEEMERRDAEMNPARMQTHSRCSFQQLARCGLKICPQRRNKGLSITLRLPYTHSNTAQRTREALLRLALFSRCVFPGNWHSLLRQWKSTKSSSVFQTTPTYGIDILTTLRGGN